MRPGNPRPPERAQVGDQGTDLAILEAGLRAQRLITRLALQRHASRSQVEVGRAGPGTAQRRPLTADAARIEAVAGGAGFLEEAAALADKR